MSRISPDSQTIEHIIRTERATLNYRLLALVVVALGIYLRRETVDILPAVLIVTAYLVYLLLLGRAILPHVRSQYVVYGMALVDAVAIAAGLYLVGGPQSSLFFLFPLFIIYHAMFLGYRTAIFSAVAFSLAYIALNYITLGTGQIDIIIAIQIPFLILVGILAGYLSARRLEEHREKEDLQEFIRVQVNVQNILETTKTLTKTWEPLLLLEEAAVHFSSILGLPYSVVALWDKGEEEGKRLLSPTLHPALKSKRKDALDLVLSSAGLDVATIQVLEKGSPLVFEEPADIEKRVPAWARELKVSGLLVAPLRTREENFGVAYIFDIGVKHRLGEEQLKLAKSYGELVAESLYNARLYRDAQARFQRLTGELGRSVQRLDNIKQAKRKPEVLVGDLRLDMVKKLAYAGNKPVVLSPAEFGLLSVLAENAGHPVNQETLWRRMRSDDSPLQSNTVEVSLHYLRRKLESASSRRWIISVRGQGYMLLKQPLPLSNPQNGE